jgi:hypothetical protein
VRKDFFISVFRLYLWLILLNSGIAEAKSEYRFIDPNPVYVSITNFHSSESVRCQLVLAHFVTYDPPVLLAGETLVIPITLEQHNSTLFLVDSGSPMAIEDLFCALDSAWSDTRLELSLAPLQSSTTPHLIFSCGIELQFSCIIEGGWQQEN